MARWFLGPPAWKDLEAILSDRPSAAVSPPITVEHTGQRTVLHRPETIVPYAELHAHSHFSFLDGASAPEDMARQAAALGLEAIALVDHDGLYGVVRFAKAAAEEGVATVIGAELTLGLEPGAVGVRVVGHPITLAQSARRVETRLADWPAGRLAGWLSVRRSASGPCAPRPAAARRGRCPS